MAGSCIKLRNIKRALELEPSNNLSYIIAGRVEKFRTYRAINFIDLVDGSTSNHLQTVIQKKLLKKPEIGSYLILQGNLVASSGSQQSLEFNANHVKYLGPCDPSTYPLATDYHALSDDFYRRWPHVRPRVPHYGSFLRVMSDMDFALHLTMRQMDFFRIYGPSLTSNDSEASSDLFLVQKTKSDDRKATTHGEDKVSVNVEAKELENHAVTDGVNQENRDNVYGEQESASPLDDKRIIRTDYFKKDVFLSTSAQLHLEMMAGSLSRVYSLEAAFRAESSITRRHLSEFHMFELEEANLEDLVSLINRAESVVKSVAKYLSEEANNKLDFIKLVELNKNIDCFRKLTHSEFIRMSYGEAMQTLRDKTDFQGKTEYGSDIGRLHEKALLKYCNDVPIVITNYPKHLKPFYMKCDSADKEAQCFDLIVPFAGELCGGSLREDSLDKLTNNLTSLNISLENKQFDWYLDSRRFGTFPHGGFGIGIERFLQSLLGIKNIRDTTPFPRWPGHCPM